MLTLKSEFAEIPQYIAKSEEKKDTTIQDFKKLIKEYGENNILDSEELSDLQNKIIEVEGKTKIELQKLLDDVNVYFPNSQKSSISKPIIISNIKEQEVKTLPEETEIQKLKNLAEGDNSLTIEGNKAYFNVKCEDGKPHRAYFTIKEGSSIKDQSSLDIWKIRVTTKLQDKYKLEFKEVKEAHKEEQNNNIEDKKFSPEFNLFIKREFKGSRNPDKYVGSNKQHLSAYKSPHNIMTYRVKMDNGDIHNLRLTEKEAIHYNELVDSYNIKVGNKRRELKEKQNEDRKKRGQENLDNIKSFFGINES